MTETRLLILDIDGTVRHGRDDLGRFVNCVDDVIVFSGAVDRMRAWKAAGGRIIGVSNQGGVGLGLVPATDVAMAMIETERQCVDTDGRALFDAVAYCEHAPDNRACWCRKPLPGLVFQLLARLELTHPAEMYPRGEAVLVGDRQDDVDLAAVLDVPFQWAQDWRNA